jgi:hypothetical protein
MRKAKLSVHKTDVVAVCRAFSLEVPAGSLEDLAEVSLGRRVWRWGADWR